MLTPLSLHLTLFGRCLMGIACVIGLWATLAIEARRGQGRAAEQWAGAVFGGVVLAVLAYNAWTLIQVIYL